MEAKASELGANAVIGVRFQTSMILTGFTAMLKILESKKNIILIFKDLEANFLKRAEVVKVIPLRKVLIQRQVRHYLEILVMQVLCNVFYFRSMHLI